MKRTILLSLLLASTACKTRQDSGSAVLGELGDGTPASPAVDVRALAETCAPVPGGEVSEFGPGAAPIQAVVGSHGEAVVVLIVDRQPALDWWSQGQYVLPEGRIGTDLASAGVGARYNEIFVQNVQALLDAGIVAATKAAAGDDKPIHIVGRGAAGSVAQLLAYVFRRQFVNVAGVHAADARPFINAEGATRFKRELAQSQVTGGPLAQIGEAGLGAPAQRFAGSGGGKTRASLSANDQFAVLCFADVSPETSWWSAVKGPFDASPPNTRLGTDLVAAGVGSRFNGPILAQLAALDQAALNAAVEQLAHSGKAVHVTGKGAGGALAQLYAWVLERRFIQVESVVSIGAPAYANPAFMDAFTTAFGGRLRQ